LGGSPWDTREAIVKACSCVTVGTRIDAELMQYLERVIAGCAFGAFQLGNANQVLFNSILGGENMDLGATDPASVVTIADTYDDIITEKFGGQRAVDLHLLENHLRNQQLTSV